VLEVGAAVEVLESPGETERESDEGDARGAVSPLLIQMEFHGDQRLEASARRRSASASPASSVRQPSHAGPGWGAQALPPIARSVTPAGSGRGCTTSSPRATGLRITSWTAMNEV